MWASDLIPVDAAVPDADDDPHGFVRGLVYLVVFAVPLWGAIIGLAWLVA